MRPDKGDYTLTFDDRETLIDEAVGTVLQNFDIQQWGVPLAICKLCGGLYNAYERDVHVDFHVREGHVPDVSDGEPAEGDKDVQAVSPGEGVYVTGPHVDREGDLPGGGGSTGGG